MAISGSDTLDSIESLHRDPMSPRNLMPTDVGSVAVIDSPSGRQRDQQAAPVSLDPSRRSSTQPDANSTMNANAGPDNSEASQGESASVAMGKEQSVFADVIELTKPRIVTMILVTTVASALIASATLAPLAWVWLLVGTGFVAASAGAANQIWERVIDTRMPRTASRPIPAGRMRCSLAVVLTAVAGVGGTVMLAAQFGWMPAAVGVATWALYVLIYTPMKTRTAWNTTVGAVAGALPVFMGYTAAGGELNEVAGWMLFGVLACWQYPHFMAIAWLYRRQYGEAGFQMTTTVEPTGRDAAWQSIVGSVALAACGITICFAPAGVLVSSAMSWISAALVMLACWPLLRAALRFRRSPEDSLARKMLRWSLVVLPAVLLVTTVRVVLG